MKFLILLLISFNVFAEYKVNIVNSEGQTMSKDGFATEADALNFIALTKHRWGKDRRWTRVDCGNSTDTREVEEEGMVVTEYDCPQTYTATTEDISAQRADEALDAAIETNIKCGEKVKKFITKRNILKGLTKADVKKIIRDYADINDMLNTGSLETAIDEITNNLTINELVTQDDKDAILLEINSCKAN